MSEPYVVTLTLHVHTDDADGALAFANYLISYHLLDPDFGSYKVVGCGVGPVTFDHDEYERWCCPRCGTHDVGDDTIFDHNMCHACHEKWQFGELSAEGT